MKYILALILLCFLVPCCNLDEKRKLSEKEMKELAKAHNDSVQVVVDSMQKLSIYVPPLYDKKVFDSATTVRFFDLAKSTDGELKLSVNSKLVSTEVTNIITSNSEDNADLLILMDKTGSMEDDIDNVKAGLGKIIDALESFKNIRLGIALYGDKNVDGPDWFSFKNFETNYSGARKFINAIEVTAGGDYPESVYDGFFEACKQNFWRSQTKRMIILIGDAPPLEKPLSKYELGDVIAKAEESRIKMNFYPIVVSPEMDEIALNDKAVVSYKQEKIATTVFPNPASNVLNISLTKEDTYSIEVFNAVGAQVLSDKFSGNLWKKDISKLPNGTYAARIVRADKKFETVKFVVYK